MNNLYTLNLGNSPPGAEASNKGDPGVVDGSKSDPAL